MEGEDWEQAAKLLKQIEAEQSNYRDTRALLSRLSAQEKSHATIRKPGGKARPPGMVKAGAITPLEWVTKNIKWILTVSGILLAILVIGYVLIHLKPWQPKTLAPEMTETMSVQTPETTETTADEPLVGTLPTMTIQASNQALRAIAFSPDDTKLASAGEEQIISLWNVQTGDELYHEKVHENIITSLAWSPDGTWLASGSDDYSIKIWDIATTGIVKTLLGHENYVRSIAWSPGGKWLVSGEEGYRLIVWDIDEGTIHSSAEIDTSFYGVSWSPDGNYVAASTRDSR